MPNVDESWSYEHRHDMICKRRRVWKKAYPNVPAPDGYIYRQRGANSRMEDYL